MPTPLIATPLTGAETDTAADRAESVPSQGCPLLAALARFERPLIRYAMSQGATLELARDTVQDTFIKLAREKPSGDTESLAPWLFTVCKRRLIDQQRKNSRLIAMDTATLPDLASTAADPTQALQEKERGQQIKKLVAALPERQRNLIRLKFEAGLSYREIAAATGLSLSNIGFIIHTAVQSLRSSCLEAGV